MISIFPTRENLHRLILFQNLMENILSNQLRVFYSKHAHCCLVSNQYTSAKNPEITLTCNSFLNPSNDQGEPVVSYK